LFIVFIFLFYFKKNKKKLFSSLFSKKRIIRVKSNYDAYDTHFLKSLVPIQTTSKISSHTPIMLSMLQYTHFNHPLIRYPASTHFNHPLLPCFSYTLYNASPYNAAALPLSDKNCFILSAILFSTASITYS